MPGRIMEELNRYGPAASEGSPPSLAMARTYCKQLSETHYENFTVVSWLLPKQLRQHFCNIYSYCRWADDLADETSSPQHSLELLQWWEQQLDDCYRGVCRHPVFV